MDDLKKEHKRLTVTHRAKKQIWSKLNGKGKGNKGEQHKGGYDKKSDVIKGEGGREEMKLAITLNLTDICLTA